MAEPLTGHSSRHNVIFRTVLSLTLVYSALFMHGKSARADIVGASDTTIEHEVAEVLTFQVDGDDMSGMVVSVTFADSSTDMAIWGTTAVGAGAATSAGWSLSLSGDTFFGGENWVLSNTSGMGITGFSIKAEIAGVVFDNVAGSNGTEGSSDGRLFDAGTSDDALVGTATFTHAISVTNPHLGVHQGDLFGILDVLITQGEIPSSSASTFTFRADTDLISQAVPEASQVVALSLVGLLMCGGAWWKRHLAMAPARG